MSDSRSRNLVPYIAGVVGVALLMSGVWVWWAGWGSQAAGERGSLSSLETTSGDTVQTGDAPSGAPDVTTPSRVPAPSSSGQEDPLAPPAASKIPAARDVELERLSEPPERSIWALSPDTYTEGLSADIEFEPFGIGPDSLGPSIVASVISSTPRQSTGVFPELVGKNVVFMIGDERVDTGGRYAAVVTTRMQDDRIVMVLERVQSLDLE